MAMIWHFSVGEKFRVEGQSYMLCKVERDVETYHLVPGYARLSWEEAPIDTALAINLNTGKFIFFPNSLEVLRIPQL